ncbi:XdhC family protein [Alicyclobacillus mali (ex Roth et al. 2021)]
MLSDLPDGHRVHAPVGLPIGAEGPDEIAVSIVAEFIHTQSGRRQAHARGVLMDTAEAGWK